MAVCWRAQKILAAIRAADPLTGLQRGLPPARHIHPLQNPQANGKQHRRGRDGDGTRPVQRFRASTARPFNSLVR